jgi:hypothetical protein
MSMGPDDPDTARNAPEERASDAVEVASAASFPASDPPAWIAMHAGSPAPVSNATAPELRGARGLTRAEEPVTEDSRHSVRHAGRSRRG